MAGEGASIMDGIDPALLTDFQNEMHIMNESSMMDLVVGLNHSQHTTSVFKDDNYLRHKE